MKKPLFFKLLANAAIITFGMILVFVLLNATLSGNVWEGMTLSRSALTGEYCEFNNVDKFFHQSMNTYTNLAYFFFGVLVLQIGIKDLKNKDLTNKNRLEKFPALSIMMGVCLIYLGFGSAFFHASLTYVSQRVDMNGTYSIPIVLLGIAVYHIFYKTEFAETIKKAWIVFLILVIIAFVQIHMMISSGKLLPALILLQTVLVLIIYFQNRKEKSFVLAISSLVLMIIAVKIRALDVQKVGCDPYSLYQGHSLWHFLTALSSFCGYAFFRFSKILS